jgi:hypothetical protein
MTQVERAVGPRGSKRRALFVLIVALATVAAMIPFMPSLLAVHDDDAFELDKNASDDTNVTLVGELGTQVKVGDTEINVCQTGSAPVVGSTILIEAERFTVDSIDPGSFGGSCSGTKLTYTVDTAATVGHSGSGVSSRVSLIEEGVTKAGPDWDEVYAEVLADADTTCSDLGLVECSYIEDGIGPSTFTGGGSKDHLPISGWQGTSGASPDKAEILNAYAAKAIVPTEEDPIGQPGVLTDHQILYFGMDRYAVDGSTDIGFWFFKNEVTFDESTGTFTGEHSIDDILALGTFTQGGATSNIRVFRWVGTGGNESGTIQGPDGTFGDCVPGSANDNGCATVNNTSIEVPWNYTFKGADEGMWVPAGGFFEGGIDLTALDLEGCFSSFLAETRSSPEITAILKDFTLGAFEACDTSMTTTPADSGGAALTDGDDEDTLPEAQLGFGAVGVDVKDTAVINVTGISEWSGTVDFFICGPIATGTCETGGVAAGSISVDQDTDPIESNSVNLTSAGRYCWRGEFDSDTEGVPDASDASEGECFEVLPVQPTLSTQAVDSGGDALTGDQPFGTALYDKATLSNTAYQPGTDGGSGYPSINATMDTPANGTITFTLWSVDGDSCVAAITASAEDETVTGDGDYMTSGFTPDAPGDYTWKASYTGDSPNTLGATHNDDCTEGNEDVTVLQLQPTMDTAQNFIPNDSATISVAAGAGDLSGNVTFELYVNDSSCTDPADQTFGPFAVSALDNGPDPLTDTVSTNNTTSYDVSGTTFHWVVTFDSGNDAHLDVTSDCDEDSSITIDNGSTQPSSP